MNFTTKLSKETLICTELQVKDYKEILKCTFGDSPDKLIFIETICRILSKVVNKPLSYVKSLNIIDMFCLLVDIRANSLGNFNVILNQNEQKFNIELDLTAIKQETANLFHQLSTTIKHDNIEVIFECPSVERLLENTKEDYLSYIKGSYLIKNSEKIFIEIKTAEQAEMFFNKISPKISLEIIYKFNKLVETITGMNYLSRYGFKEQQLVFLPSLDSLIQFTKLMFSEQLNSLYDNIFYLSYSGKMNAEYIENLAVGEYNYFVGLLRQVIASKNSAQTDQTNPSNSSVNDDDFFGEDL